METEIPQDRPLPSSVSSTDNEPSIIQKQPPMAINDSVVSDATELSNSPVGTETQQSTPRASQEQDEPTPSSSNNPPGTPQVRIEGSSASLEDTLQSTPGLTGPLARSSGDLPGANPLRNPRRRSLLLDNRASNRLSGFFSNLVNRQSTIVNPAVSKPPSTSAAPADTAPSGLQTSRPSTPPPPRPLTPPPPPLPAPSLQELGLSLSVVTDAFNVSQTSYSPSSGSFMAPHFLLLCHSQGLDFLPLNNKFSHPHPYSLVRRIPFKSVIVLEQRGVLIAIAGRSQSVRVYSLDEVRKTIDWRLEFELRKEKDKERERLRREETKRPQPIKITINALQESTREPQTSNTIKSPALTPTAPKSARRLSVGVPRTPTPNRPKPAGTTMEPKIVPGVGPEAVPAGLPPPYSASNDIAVVSRQTDSPSTTLPITTESEASELPVIRSADKKDSWSQDGNESEEEAIDVVAAQTSGSQALDERRSVRAMARRHSNARTNTLLSPPTSQLASDTTSASNSHPRTRPPLHIPTGGTSTGGLEPPSPAPTLMSLRQALASPLSEVPPVPSIPYNQIQDNEPESEEEEVAVGDRVSLAQILSESRIPDLPPAGTRQQQEPLLLSEVSQSGPGSAQSASASGSNRPRRGRRRWSILEGIFAPSEDAMTASLAARGNVGLSSRVNPSPRRPSSNQRSSRPSSSQGSGRPRVQRATSSRSANSDQNNANSQQPIRRTISAHADASENRRQAASSPPPPVPQTPSQTLPPTPTSATSTRSSRFIPRVLNMALHGRRDANAAEVAAADAEYESLRKNNPAAMAQVPPAKLDCKKLPGTKGAIMLKAVETAKKTFLAILCGANGEKVELYAGTYRTHLSLSRTFILPDSPQTMELQLQGDDLVEVFLMFPDNVFGLEPATVRVREVRIGRSERRAARERRRAMDAASAVMDTSADEPPAIEEDEPQNNPTLNVDMPPTSVNTTPLRPLTPVISVASTNPDLGESREAAAARAVAEELQAANAAMGAYTTFQQLSFSPRFPLASMADDCIIPPTYRDFLQYRGEYEADSEIDGTVNLASIQFSPPGLPAPIHAPPPKWLYKDPKGRIHGPWKAKLMQSWYKDGLLPPDLPVRREEDTDFMALKELRQQSVDPSEPFQTVPSTSKMDQSIFAYTHDTSKPLLPPISLLAQPKHYGPPALFFSSRGGHSTAIVDGRGRSVLKGRFTWSVDDADEIGQLGRLGDIRRLEAFDIRDRSVLVAVRHGGVEAVDLGDALLSPADESRATLPHFTSPVHNISRRSPFIWRIGTPIATSLSASLLPNKISKTPSVTPVSIGKKAGLSNVKSLSKSDVSATADADTELKDEIVYLGRRADDIYMCERQVSTFRILKLCPSSA